MGRKAGGGADGFGSVKGAGGGSEEWLSHSISGSEVVVAVVMMVVVVIGLLGTGRGAFSRISATIHGVTKCERHWRQRQRHTTHRVTKGEMQRRQRQRHSLSVVVLPSLTCTARNSFDLVDRYSNVSRKPLSP